jgi:hypothetical protein
MDLMKKKQGFGKKMETISSWGIFIGLAAVAAAFMLFGGNGGCFRDKTTKIIIGMPAKEVISIMGYPEYKTRSGGLETWCYGLQYDAWETENLGVKAYNGKAYFVVYFDGHMEVTKIRRNVSPLSE